MDLDDLVKLIDDDVAAALAEADSDARLDLLRALAVSAFTLAYEETGGGGAGATHATPFAGSLGPAFGLLVPDGTETQHERLAQVIAHAARNAATVAAADAAGDDTKKFEWRTQRDDRVRDLHQPMDGQVRAAGQRFNVGGHPLRYPGEPVGPPEVWMNCRCYLQLASAAGVRSAAAWTEKTSAGVSTTSPRADLATASTGRDQPRPTGGAMSSAASAGRDSPAPSPPASPTGSSTATHSHQRSATPATDPSASTPTTSSPAPTPTTCATWSSGDAAAPSRPTAGPGTSTPCTECGTPREATAPASGFASNASVSALMSNEDPRRNITAVHRASSVGAEVPCPAGGATVAAGPASVPSGVVVVARPADPAALAVEGGLPPDELHVTLGYYGDLDALDPEVARLLEVFVTTHALQTDAVIGGRGMIGFDDPQAVVLLLESPDLQQARSTLEQVAMPDRTHPHFTPHLTLGYGIELPMAHPDSVRLDRMELWRGAERIGNAPEVPELRDEDGSNGTEPELTAASDTPWSQFSASDYTLAQWKRACLLTMPGGDPESKSTYKLPVREPGGALNRNGVHAAAAALGGARGGVDAPTDAKAAAKRKLRGLYSQLGEDPPDSLKADGFFFQDEGPAESFLAYAPSTSPPGTHDAPGWLTNPRETQRLRTYWTKGEGAAKIAWGSPGDLTRCTKHLGKYVLPEHVWGTCQNLHYEALGYWNPESQPQGSIDFDEINTAIRAAFVAATDLEDPMPPPRALFDDPHLDAPTPQTVRAAGDYLEYVGHLAAWDTCHVGISGQCVPPPRTASGYAHFRLGEVETDDGFVSVGHITAGTGHASTDLTAADTVRHYDDTGTVVADVAVGEDEHGIWAHGIVRPGISEDQLHALRAGVPSGDWRRLGGTLELVGALIVNVPGFPIHRPELAASAGRDFALVAAGVVTTDPNAVDVERIAIAVVDRLAEKDRRAANVARVAALRAAVNGPRVEELSAAVGVGT